MKAYIISIAITLAVGIGAYKALSQAPPTIYPRIQGAYNHRVTQATISSTICREGWTDTIRPPYNYTHDLKRLQLAVLHYHDQLTYHYQEDHLIPLELGGAPYDPDNLWPQPWSQARRDDSEENRLNHAVCTRTITLFQAQQQILHYKQQHG